jgi:hypothetical protein
MAYEPKLIRERADPTIIRRVQEGHEVADNRVQKTLATKKIKNERKPTSTGINAQ